MNNKINYIELDLLIMEEFNKKNYKIESTLNIYEDILNTTYSLYIEKITIENRNVHKYYELVHIFTMKNFIENYL